jgi:glycosyltransferase involved in cell wall biosynthesis
MLIGIDGRELEGKPTGVGNYLRNILRDLTLPSSWQIQIFFKNEIPQCVNGKAETVLLRSDKTNLAWLHTKLASELRRRNISLFFSPTPNCAPLFDGVQAITLHDLSYFNYPEWFRFRERWIRRISTHYSLRRAQRIYAVSEYVRNEITQRFKLPFDKILVTPNGVLVKNIDSKQREILRASYGYESSKLILYVGSIFQRRHLPVLIEAISRLKADVKLIVIGENRTFPRIDLKEIANRFSVASRTIFLEYASEKVVQDYYTMADVFVYLSTYEGFGIPPLEAMSYGVPVVLSSTPAMDQIFQYSALFVPYITAQSVAESVHACLIDETLRERLVQSGLAQVEKSSWQQTARLIAADWEHLLATRS